MWAFVGPGSEASASVLASRAANRTGRSLDSGHIEHIWSVVFLSMFGADGRDSAVHHRCDYALSHSRARAPCAGFSALMELYPTGTVQCLCGKIWQDVEQEGQPSKWVTLRALRGPKRAA